MQHMDLILLHEDLMPIVARIMDAHTLAILARVCRAMRTRCDEAAALLVEEMRLHIHDAPLPRAMESPLARLARLCGLAPHKDAFAARVVQHLVAQSWNLAWGRTWELCIDVAVIDKLQVAASYLAPSQALEILDMTCKLSDHLYAGDFRDLTVRNLDRAFATYLALPSRPPRWLAGEDDENEDDGEWCESEGESESGGESDEDEEMEDMRWWRMLDEWDDDITHTEVEVDRPRIPAHVARLFKADVAAGRELPSLRLQQYLVDASENPSFGERMREAIRDGLVNGHNPPSGATLHVDANPYWRFALCGGSCRRRMCPVGGRCECRRTVIHPINASTQGASWCLPRVPDRCECARRDAVRRRENAHVLGDAVDFVEALGQDAAMRIGRAYRGPSDCGIIFG